MNIFLKFLGGELYQAKKGDLPVRLEVLSDPRLSKTGVRRWEFAGIIWDYNA